jgi:hypothetical protein
MQRQVASIVIGLTLLFGAPALAQTDTGAIVGTVRDQSGAVIPGATVTATQVETGVSVTAVTNEAGNYVFPTLRIGRYSVGAELSGFRRALRSDLQVSVQSRLQIDFRLELGELTEQVVVTGGAPLLETQRPDMGHTVDERQVTDLPLLGRRYAELALLTTGVVPATNGISSRGEDSFFNVNGNFATWNNFTLDGADNNSFSTNLQERSAQVIQPPVDALEEFKVQTRTYSAEFGKAAGAIINASIKQGTNQYKGSAFGFFRDETFNSNTWANNRAGVAKGKFDETITGFTFGGPILRSRTFFFGNYQRTRTTKAETEQGTVPTPLMRQGNLSEFPQAMRTSQFFPGCVDAATKSISASCIDPVARALLGVWPMPNIPHMVAVQGQPNSLTGPNYISNGILSNNIDQFDIRADHTMHAGRDQMFGRYSYVDTRRSSPSLLGDPVASGNFGSDIFNLGQSAVYGWTRVFGNSLLSDFRASWNRIRSDSLQPSFGMLVNSQYGIKGVPEDPRFAGGLPTINVGGVTRIGGPGFRPQYQTSQVWQFSENLTWTKGTHSFKFGFEKRRDIVWYIDLQALNGLMSFTTNRYSGIGFGDFLLGAASEWGLTNFHAADLYYDGWQGYAQDSWRVKSNLTLGYGIRYEYFTPAQDRNFKLSNILPANGQLVTAQSEGSTYDRTLINPDRTDIAPRVGLTWSATPKFVVRAGYGIFYQQTDRYGSESQMSLNPPQLLDVRGTALNQNQAPVMLLKDGFPAVSASQITPDAIRWRIQNPDQNTPTVQQFSVGPEFQVSGNMVASVEYVGNRTKNGRKIRNINQGIITGPSTVVFPYAQYGYGAAYLQQIATDGYADYNSLQMKLQRRFSKGLGFTTSYTYGRAYGNFMAHLEGGSSPQNAHALDADYGPLNFDITHRFVGSFVYELPIGQGRTFSPGGIAGGILGNWNINGIFVAESGLPYSVTGSDQSSTGPGHTMRANCVGDPMPDDFTPTLDRWFNTAAFSQPAAFTFGNCPINSLRAPGKRSMNMSIFKVIPLSDARRLELRLESFNTFNWIQWGSPGSNVSNPGTFGRISNTIHQPRELQFAVKFYF